VLLWEYSTLPGGLSAPQRGQKLAPASNPPPHREHETAEAGSETFPFGCAAIGFQNSCGSAMLEEIKLVAGFAIEKCLINTTMAHEGPQRPGSVSH
jgi:hypothetical protein